MHAAKTWRLSARQHYVGLLVYACWKTELWATEWGVIEHVHAVWYSWGNSDSFSVPGPSTRRHVKPLADSRRGSNPVFQKFSNCLDNFQTLCDTVLATEQCFYISVLPTVWQWENAWLRPCTGRIDIINHLFNTIVATNKSNSRSDISRSTVKNREAAVGSSQYIHVVLLHWVNIFYINIFIFLFY